MVPDQSAVTNARVLVEEMFCHFSSPEELHSDQDGLEERFNRTTPTTAGLGRTPPFGLWAYWTAMQESTQLSPAALMFGHKLRTLVDLVFGLSPEPELPQRPGMEYFSHLRERLRALMGLPGGH